MGMDIMALLMASQAATIAIPPATTCRFDAWPSYRLTRSLAVRSRPTPRAPVVGMLPVGGGYPYSVLFNVRGTRAGFVRIDGASDAYNEDAADEGGRPLPRRTVYSGAGWVAADAVTVRFQSGRGRARPDPGAPLVIDLGSDWLTDMGRVDAIRGCSGEWVLVDYTIERRRDANDRIIDIAAPERLTGRAWFRGLCAVEETTCDMRSVDDDAPAAAPPGL